MLTTWSPFLRSTISDSKTSKSKGGRKNKVKIPENNIPNSLVNRLMGVLEDSAKGVKKNSRKNTSLSIYPSKISHHWLYREIIPKKKGKQN